MRTVRFELLRPHEINEEKARLPLIYLPVGPLEWHGPHLALGMDPLNAEAVARLVAEEVGGLVLPTLYLGTERERDPDMLQNIGFRGDEWIVGMDFPANSMASLYFPEEVFAIVIREYLRLLVKQGYQLIVIMNGHGAENQIKTLQRLSKEFTAENNCTVLCPMATFLDDAGEQDLGHASKVETSILTYLHPECVDLGQLPARDLKLRNVDYAIVDDQTFRGNPNHDFTVRNDPRDATRKLGEDTVARSVRIISKMVRDAMNEIKLGNPDSF